MRVTSGVFLTSPGLSGSSDIGQNPMLQRYPSTPKQVRASAGTRRNCCFSPRSWSARRCPADRAGKPCSASRVHPRGTHDAGLNRRRRYASRPACLAYRWFVRNGIPLALDLLSFLFRHCSHQVVRLDLYKRIVTGFIPTRAYPGGRLSVTVRPAGCLVDGVGKALGLDEGLDQHGRGVVALGPILGQLAADEGEDVRAPLVVRAELEIVHRALSAKTGRAALRRLRRRIRGCPRSVSASCLGS